ncbi:hypothetical protein ASPWEDRAFT_168263 [Aspergillus wentii DTO 134E9]|uniref:RING-type domain-containing protein n=1 Tax=Aspergillus wentii DTO 134E9 TaxID=1073089 RepID=A0A1L9RTU7_ASPWE|nr:uncharacterized protein ASPWEDRAFT_168263 [Aspergillus wentii DTO 134E9]KAI9933986.1 hypothetical protein MW887_005058 [Aspergillus wentii]OJJ38350.1 hypothetical protein ASPWEDRAFT_168263 [Aspergillus wentii DTO 134E9]
MDQPLSHQNTLSSILKVYPLDEHRCLGYTLSNRRRCMNPTNATSRNTASSLLERGTRMLEQAESIDSLLECLAPMVLCRRYHQNQARGLASRWKEKVTTHIREQEARREAESQAEVEDEAEEHSEEEQGELNLGIEPPPDATWRGSIIPGFRTSSGHVTWSDVFEGNHDIQTRPQTENVEERRESNTETVSTREERQQEISRVETPSRTHTVSISTRIPERKGITRRPIEGDCGICILPLLDETVQPAGDTQAGDDDADYESDTGDESDSASSVATVSIEESEELVWCKARCGINYHRNCLKTWIDTFRGKPGHSPTCPTCRSVWRR